MGGIVYGDNWRSYDEKYPLAKGDQERAEMEHGKCPQCGTAYVITSPAGLKPVDEWLAKSDQAMRDINTRLVDLQKEVRSLSETLAEFTPLARRAAKLFDNSRVIKIRQALNGKRRIKRQGP